MSDIEQAEDVVLECTCFSCGNEREFSIETLGPGLRLTLHHGADPCECGESRVRVTLDTEGFPK